MGARDHGQSGHPLTEQLIKELKNGEGLTTIFGEGFSEECNSSSPLAKSKPTAETEPATGGAEITEAARADLEEIGLEIEADS